MTACGDIGTLSEAVLISRTVGLFWPDHVQGPDVQHDGAHDHEGQQVVAG